MLRKVSRILSVLVLSAVTCGLVVVPNSVRAQEAEAVANLKKPVPEFNEVTEEDFQIKTVLYKEVPHGDAFLEYEVRLPRDWKKSNEASGSGISLSNRVLGEVVRYYGPVRLGERSYFSIQAHALDYQLTAEQWFAGYVIENGYTLQGMNVLNANRIEALYVLIEGDVTYVVRAIAQINGKRITLAQHVIPGDFFVEERGMQEKIVDSFKLLAPDASFVEKMKVHKFLDIAQFSYPDSWFVRAKKVKTIDRMEADIYRSTHRQTTFFNILELLTGKIGIHVVSAYVLEDVDDQVTIFKDELKEHGLVFGEIIENPDNFEFSDDLNFSHIEVYSVKSEKERLKDYEYWVSLMNYGEYYYFVTLLTPARNQEFNEWARNTQTFRVVSQLIGPQK